MALILSLLRANEMLISQARIDKIEKRDLKSRNDYLNEYKGKLYLHEIRTDATISNCRKCTKAIKKDKEIQILKNWIGEEN